MENDKQLLSLTIAWTRYPLMVGVVLLHTIIIGQIGFDGNVIAAPGEYPLFDIVCYISQRSIGDVCVPSFFVISGFLFYYETVFSKNNYINKLKRRIKTLLIPYLFWNIAFMLYIIALFYIRPEWMNSMRSYAEGFDCKTFFRSFWCIHDGPVLGPLWFVQDLLVMSVISYPLYFIIKKIGIVFCLVIGVIWIWNMWNGLPGIRIISLFFFSLGAYFSISLNVSSIVIIRKFMWLLVPLWGTMVFVDTFIIHIIQFHRFLLLFGTITFFSVAMWCVDRKILTIMTTLGKTSFFVFAFHMFVINFPNKLWCALVPINAFTCSIAQWAVPVSVSLICSLFYYYLRLIMPKFLSLVVGGR